MKESTAGEEALLRPGLEGSQPDGGPHQIPDQEKVKQDGICKNDCEII